MSAVDVIDAAINKVRQHAWPQTMDLEEARDAVAELIAADLEYDEASAAYNNQWTLIDAAGLGARVTAAIERRRTALANIGAAP